MGAAGIKKRITIFERYPVYGLEQENGPNAGVAAILSQEEIADFEHTQAAWEAWQDRLEKLFDAAPETQNAPDLPG